MESPGRNLWGREEDSLEAVESIETLNCGGRSIGRIEGECPSRHCHASTLVKELGIEIIVVGLYGWLRTGVVLEHLLADIARVCPNKNHNVCI